MPVTSFSPSSSFENISGRQELLADILKESSSDGRCDRFRRYPFREGDSRDAYFERKTRDLIGNAEPGWNFTFNDHRTSPTVIATHSNEWDLEHFDVSMASLQFLVAPLPAAQKDETAEVLVKSLDDLRDSGTQYVSARVAADHLAAIHACEDLGFRYFETVVWAVVATNGLEDVPGIRLMRDDEIDEVAELAAASQFRMGHLYLDERFDSKLVDSMYSKWVRTHAANGRPIAVMDGEDGLAGFFVFALDPMLDKYAGRSFAHLQLLALSPKQRGRGAGQRLFQGTLSLIRSMGVDFIDTGYASRNHKSARLHTISNFFSVYDELTFHLWLDRGESQTK